MSNDSSAPMAQRLIAISLVSLSVISLAGCGGDSIYAENSASSSSTTVQRDPNKVYPKHDKGIEPDTDPEDINTEEKFDRLMKIYDKWGAKQTPDWIAICNAANIPEMRKMGFDPQNDLQDRQTGQHKWNCYWATAHDNMQFYFGRMESLQAANTRKGFELQKTIKRYGNTYYIGHVYYLGEGTPVLAFSCTVNFESNGVAYSAAFLGKDPKPQEQACDELINMATKSHN